MTCQNATLITLGRGAINARTLLDYQVTQGELRQARVRVPAGFKLLRLEGESIRTWELKPDTGGPILVVDLLKGIAPSYRLTLETEHVLEALPATVKAEIPHPLEVKREAGVVALRSNEELELVIGRVQAASRVDAEEFARAAGQKTEGALNAFRFLKPEFTVEAQLAAQQPQIEAVVRNRVRVGPEQVALSATIDYTIKRAGVFALNVAIPDDYLVEAVTSSNLLQWVERSDAGRRLVEVTLKERAAGAYSLKFDLVRNLKELPRVLPIAGLHPLAAQKLAGFVSIAAEPGVAIQPASAEGLTEIPAGAAADGEHAVSGGLLGYKYLAAEPQATAAWKLAIGTELVESWVRAEIINTLTLAENLVSGRALARFEIQNAPVKELRLRIPAAFKNVEISGANIRRRDQEGESWRIEFQTKVRGTQILTVTWEQAQGTQTNRLDLLGIGAEAVERETGLLAIVAHPPLQVTEQAASDLQPIDNRELPEWAGKPDEATVLAYLYLRPGYALTLEARRFEQAEVLEALVEKLDLTTVVAEDGQMMTELAMSVRNHGRQYLEVALPSGAKLWSAFVAGQAVRPSVQGGKVLLPLERSVGEDAPLRVEVTYAGTGAFPQTRGSMELVSPTLDVPLKSARWALFLPPDYRYSEFTGTMTRETATVGLGWPAQASSFSLLDYNRKESESKVEVARALKSELASAQKNLSSGNVKEALSLYSRAKIKGNFEQNPDKDAQLLEQQLRVSAANNLINAQNSFANNGAALAGQNAMELRYGLRAPDSASRTDLLGANSGSVQYDTSAAEAQWAKLQQAQELGATRVQPIRVNLPTHGLRQAFTQVLQTETGKPLTIRLLASNEKVISWPKRVGSGLGAFLVMWALIAALLPRRRATA